MFFIISSIAVCIRLYNIDDSISDKVACLIEPFTVGCRAARRAQPKQGENFVVFGCGTIGLASASSLNGEVANIDGFIDASGADEILDIFMEQGKIESRFVCVAVNKSIRSIINKIFLRSKRGCLIWQPLLYTYDLN